MLISLFEIFVIDLSRSKERIGAATGHETPPPTVLFLRVNFGRITAAGRVVTKHWRRRS